MRAFARNAEGAIVAGDIITALDGQAVASLDDLLTQLERHQPGDTVKVQVNRAGQTLELPVALTVSN